MTAKQPIADGFIPETVFDAIAPELTRNYAEALLNASGDDQSNAVVEDLEAIQTDVLEVQPRFASILGSPSVSIHREGPDLDRHIRGKSPADGRPVPPGPESPRPAVDAGVGDRSRPGPRSTADRTASR